MSMIKERKTVKEIFFRKFLKQRIAYIFALNGNSPNRPDCWRKKKPKLSLIDDFQCRKYNAKDALQQEPTTLAQ